MTTKHTPGPWTLEAGRSFVTSSGSFYITYGKDRYNNPNFRDFCELDANASLIAAAPNLLAALELIQEIMQREEIAASQNNSSLSSAERQAKMLARAAIAKATGDPK